MFYRRKDTNNAPLETFFPKINDYLKMFRGKPVVVKSKATEAAYFWSYREDREKPLHVKLERGEDYYTSLEDIYQDEIDDLREYINANKLEKDGKPCLIF